MTYQPDAPPPLRSFIDDPDFDEGAPLDANSLRRAAEFMSTVREIQRESGLSLRGRKWLSNETLQVSSQVSQGSALLARLAQTSEQVVPTATQRQVFESFEEMCRRRKVPLPSDLRPAVYRLLGIEVAVNSHVLEATPEQVAPATVYNGFLDRLPEAYAEFRETLGVFRTAANAQPSDPEGFLEEVQKAVSRLEQDERFAGFRDTPFVFLHAAIHNRSNPEGFLKGMQEAVSRLEQDERFAGFRDIFRHAAIRNPSDPEGFLDGVQEAVSRLEQDAHFADLRDTPGIFRKAAVSNPSDPEGFLQRVQQAVTRLKQDERFAGFRDTPGVFRRAAVNYLSDPERFLEGVQQAVSRLEQDERFAGFRDTPGVFRTAAIDYPSDPEGHVLNLLAAGPQEPKPEPRIQPISTASGSYTSLDR